MSDATKFLDQHGQAHTTAANAVNRLRSLAFAMERLGMSSGRELEAMADVLDRCLTDMNQAFSGQIHEAFVRAEQSSHNLLMGTLAGVALAGGKDGQQAAAIVRAAAEKA